MYRVELVLGLVVVAAWIYSVVTCVLTPDSEVRGIPKFAWLILIVLLPLLGSVLWIGVGRTRMPRAPRFAGPGPAAPGLAAPRTYSALTADERIRRMEEDLARLEREEPSDDDDRGQRPARG